MPRSMFARTAATGALLALTACSSSDGGGSGIGAIGSIGGASVPYQHSNAIMTSGYSETVIAPDRYRIQVKGPGGASRERFEKIATARAAEIGRDQRLGHFRIEGMQVASSCQNFRAMGKAGTAANAPEKTLTYAILTAEVSYAKNTTDPTYRSSKDFDALRAAVDQPDTSSAPAVDPAQPGQCS